MVRVFISQPMRGKAVDEIVSVRDAAFARACELYAARGEECREVPSYFGESAPAQMSPLELLGKQIELMGHADVAVFAPGWEDARGCRIERLCAQEYGVEVIEL